MALGFSTVAVGTLKCLQAVAIAGRLSGHVDC